MFAVPGWSVKSESLKVETAPVKGAENGGKKSKKRKRQGEGIGSEDVDELYRKVVEKEEVPGEAPLKKQKKEKKIKKKEVNAEENGAGEAKDQTEEKPGKKAKDKKKKKNKNDEKAEGNATEDTVPPPQPESKKNKKRNKGKKANDETPPQDENHQQQPQPQPQSQPEQPPKPDPSTALPLAPFSSSTKLTPLQQAMRAKLIPARFRHLNETLYTRPSAEAFRLFQDDPALFDEYHAGFRQQVGVWPENPVDGYIAALRHRAALPRSRGVCTVADLGCGDARLAAVLEPEKKKLRLDIKSFDLHSPSPLVTRADIANLPLADGSINVAIFCLALMGTNWLDFIEEAYRILTWKGELWIAEIKSRFGRPRHAPAPVSHSVGHRRKTGKKPKDDAAAPPDPALFGKDLEVEVDGQDDRRHETDVTAFVEALRRRGFVLRDRGERTERDSVDLSNRMFVKMYFVKGVAPSVGKSATREGAWRGERKRNKPWAADDEGQDDAVDESAILKPCVYKLR